MPTGAPQTILFLDHAPIWGGAQVVLVNVLSELDRQKFRPLVGVPHGSPLVGRLETLGINWHPVAFRPLNRAGLRLPRNLGLTVFETVRLIRAVKPDLIVTNGVRTHVAGALAGAMTGLPVIWTLHDNTFPLGLYRLLAALPRRIVAVSGWLRDLYGAVGHAQKVVVVHNGLPPTVADADGACIRREFGIPGETPLVLTVGRLIKSKAPHLMIAAAADILAAHPQTHFLIVGGPDPDSPDSLAYAAGLALQIETAGLANRVHLAGPRADVQDCYAAADLFVYPAAKAEGLPTVLLEAMAHGLPVLASALGGALEIVQDGVTGRLCTPGDAEALTKCLNEMLAETERRRRWGDAGRQRVATDFALQRQVTILEDLYRQVLQTD